MPSLDSEARRILLDGRLLAIIESLALQLSNKFDFARRIVQEFALILTGQLIKYLNVGQIDRAYSHAGIYAPLGLGKDFSWRLIENSGIFPLDTFRIHRLENITEAALIGTVTESTIVPPPAVTEDVVFVGEYATFMRGQNAASIAADMRAMIENGEYRRRLAKIAYLKETLHAPKEEWKKNYLQEQMDKYKKQGMIIDLDKCEIYIKTTTSWTIASARFGSVTAYGRPLLSMGDINRYRWRSYLPTREERFRIASEVGGLPPVIVNAVKKRSCNEAWKILTATLRRTIAEGSIEVPRDEASFQARKKVWDHTMKEMMDLYSDKMSEVYVNQLINLRTRAEFTRIMYQHAAFKQFERDQGYDFAPPSKFIINYDEDGEFARQLWINEYVPSMMDVINDVLKKGLTRRTMKVTKTEKGMKLVVDLLHKESIAKRENILKELQKHGIEDESLVDNQILRGLVEHGIVKRDKPGWYSLTGKQSENSKCMYDVA